MASKIIVSKENKTAPTPTITIVEVASEDIVPMEKASPVPIITVVEVDSGTITSKEKAAPIPIPDDPEELTSISSFANLCWLFSKSDISTFVVPDTTFGILGALSGPLLTTNSSPNLFLILARTPLVVFFVWINIFVFELANQRFPEAIVEDSKNKPWRPLPNGLISPVQARRLLFTVLPPFLGLSYFLGMWKETSLLFTLTWIYNNLKGGNEDFVVRNLIIAAAFGVYNEGALRIACGGQGHAPTETGFVWTALVSAIIVSTMHVQDMQDQVDDLAKGRRSTPIFLGDHAARWTVAVPVVFWSLFCPLYWGIGVLGWLLPVGMGFVVAFRELWFRGPEADHTTWVLWAGWLSSLYLLSVLKSPPAIANWMPL